MEIKNKKKKNVHVETHIDWNHIHATLITMWYTFSLNELEWMRCVTVFVCRCTRISFSFSGHLFVFDPHFWLGFSTEFMQHNGIRGISNTIIWYCETGIGACETSNDNYTIIAMQFLWTFIEMLELFRSICGIGVFTRFRHFFYGFWSNLNFWYD